MSSTKTKKRRPKGARLSDVEKYAIHGMLLSGLSAINIKAVLNFHDDSHVVENYLQTVNNQKEYNLRLQKGVCERLIQGGIPAYISENLATKTVNATTRKPGLAFDIEVDEIYRLAVRDTTDKDLMLSTTTTGQPVATMNRGVGLKEAEKALENPIKASGRTEYNNPDVFIVPNRK